MVSLEVEICGRKYKLKSENPQKLRAAAEILNNQLIELTEQYDSLDFTKILILNGLQLHETIIELNEHNRELQDEIERMNQLVSGFIPEITEK